MDNEGLSGDPRRIDDSLLINHVGNEASDDSALPLRLKNDGRYVARKHHEADLRTASVDYPQVSSSTPELLLSVPVEVVDLSVSSTRVYCSRDWKKDARRRRRTSKDGISVSATQSETAVNGGFSRGLQPSRRNWKADARNKRSSD
ncbi:hypothetical protein M569_13877 [Genlisea aurea]|uniref:Uncharacterized protein n=1 Tax=Genlisea aurea TaxID=192259 RepID=S8C2B8_9LAMI|nr:hypothetical protein M569_13877 [Genlisea aurea]